jgi:rare lipoprotein A
MKRPVFLLAAFLAACSSTPQQPSSPDGGLTPSAPSAPSAPSRGGYYKDDGPGAQPPSNLSEIPDAVPRKEPLHRYANRPYQVFGKDYVPLAAGQAYRERGTASWYGKKFHGQKTSSGEVYDMYAMTAAHRTLPIPSYARVTNVANGRSVIVRINDRGPFHSERIIDLSYAAAYRLGYIQAGSATVEVESIDASQPVQEAKREDLKEEAGVYVQVGAFSSRDNAEDLRERVARQLAWLSEQVRVLAEGGLWRLRVGPYASNDAARSVAERIEMELKLKPLLVVR